MFSPGGMTFCYSNVKVTKEYAFWEGATTKGYRMTHMRYDQIPMWKYRFSLRVEQRLNLPIGRNYLIMRFPYPATGLQSR